MTSFQIKKGAFCADDDVELEDNGINGMTLLRKTTRERKDVDIELAYLQLGKLRAAVRELTEHNSSLTEDSTATPAASASMVALQKARAAELIASLGLEPGKEVVIEDLDMLIEAIEAFNIERLEESRQRVAEGRIQFLDLAELYQAGMQVVGPVAGLNHEMAFVVRSCYFEEVNSAFGRKHTCTVELEFVASVGDRFSIIRCNEQVGWWQGLREMSALGLRPLQPEFQEILEERGRAFADVSKGSRLLACRLGAFHTSRRKDGVKASRVMVDIVAAMEAGMGLGSSSAKDAAPNALDGQTVAYKKAVRQGRLDGKDANVQRDEASGLVIIDQMAFFDTVPPERLWNCWPMVPAFDFTLKAWGLAEVSGLSEIDWKEDAWDALVLPAGRKALIRAVVQQQRNVQGVDVIKGKGEGTTFLLFGASGTGKTLTAEALAEVLHKPLYVLSAGEMGTNPGELEKNLSTALKLCTRWDCICLIDESDIFLEERNGTDVLRNALVCVMLRQLEYHPGVLFLTTNKVKGIDPAIQSRLTLALKYDHLTESARKAIWAQFLAKVKGGPFEIDRLAAPQLNGRQIKNCIKLSMALALERGTGVTQRMLSSTLQTICTFQHDLQEEDEPDVGALFTIPEGTTVLRDIRISPAA